MSEDVKLRRAAAGAVLRTLRNAKARGQLEELGHRSGQPIITVLDTDSLGAAFGRVFDENPAAPAILAMYRAEKHRVVFFSLDVGGPDQVELLPVGHAASIGMLYDTMQAERRRTITVTVNWPTTGSAQLHVDEFADA